MKVLRQYIGSAHPGASDITDGLEQAIEAGTVVPGERLPTIRELASSLDVAPNTVAAAYRALAERGLVEGRGRLGSFVVERVRLSAQAPELPPGLIDLATGSPDPRLLPDLGPFLSSIDPTHVAYGAPPMEPALASVATELFSSSGVDPSNLAVVNGALDGIERALGAHLRFGDGVAIESPGWEPLSALVASMGLKAVRVDIDDHGIIPEALAAVVDSVRAVLLTPRCQNPTGAAIDEPRAAELRAVLERRPDLLTIEDDHGGLIAGPDLTPVAQDRPRWAHVHSVNKALGPDLRVAVLAGDHSTIRRIVDRQGVGPGWVSHLSQRLTAALLTDPGVRDLLDRARESYHHRRMDLVQSLAEAGIAATGRSGLNVWVEVPKQAAAVAALAAAGFAVQAGEDFGEPRRPGIRIAVSNLELDMTGAITTAIASTLRHRPPRR